MIQVRLFAAARDAAGSPSVEVEAGTVPELIGVLVKTHGERFGRVLATCTLLVDGRRVDASGGESLPDGAVVDVLPPFAGG
ncbi:MAG: MoaD family protein [Candidatus Nanopelagicales bacterium]|nr:MoaD family protein [Candidatus Nanopelagicales bacterium]MDZ4250680.1 MoaD family protein [Candidatus Nanopelagicales bacterium]